MSQGRDTAAARKLLQTAAYSNRMWPPKFAWLIRQLIESGANAVRIHRLRSGPAGPPGTVARFLSTIGLLSEAAEMSTSFDRCRIVSSSFLFVSTSCWMILY